MLSRQTAAMPVTKYDTVMLGGGLDLVTPRLQLDPGAARRMMNYECGINGGYTRIKGYERYDGRMSPSSVTYTLLPIPTFLGTATVGTTLTGLASASTGTIIAVGANYVAVANVIGSGFQQDEMTSVSGVVIGRIGPQTVRLSKTLRKQYVNLAADVFRAFILAVPGTGPVRGVFGAIFKGAFAVYAIRDESLDNDRAALYKATTVGWTQVWGFTASNHILEQNFRNGGPVPIPDNTNRSTFTHVALRVVLTGGSWASNTATGKMLYTASNNATLLSGATMTFGATTITTLNYTEQGGDYGFSAASRLPIGGVYEFVYSNFYGQSESARIYACNGVGRAFEFDGQYVVPIDAGTPSMDGDAINGVHPSHIVAHQHHLFVSVGSSVLHSGLGTPHDWTALAGAGEIATGDAVTGFKVLPGSQGSGAMAITGRNQVKVLYGTALAGPEPFDLVNFESETGAIANTLQTLDRVYYLDDRGVIDLKTAQEYGNFVAATLTRHIQPFMELKRGRAVCSTVNRSKGQYRVLFLDGTGLYLTLDNGKLVGCAPVAFPHQFACAWSGEDSSGVEHAYLGSREGYVYEMERGTSFDGDTIDADVLLNWNAMGTPRQRKSYRGASLEFSEETDHVELRVAARLGPHVTAHHQEDEATHVSGSELDMQWDHFTWGEGWYDGQILSPMKIPLTGTAERVQYRLVSSSDYLESYTLTSIITRYFPRRGAR